MTDINAIKARLNSISPTAMSKLPKAVQTLLKEDMPRLIELAYAVQCHYDELLKKACENNNAFGKLCLDIFPESPEQQIKDMPW